MILNIAVHFEPGSGAYVLVIDGSYVGSFKDVVHLKDAIDDRINVYIVRHSAMTLLRLR